MEAMLGISLDSYLYLKLAKTLCLSYYLLCFLFNKIVEQEGKTVYAWKQDGVGEITQTLYTHVSKCKNDKKTKICIYERENNGRNFKIHYNYFHYVQYEEANF
jgi:hypothetical protein